MVLDGQGGAPVPPDPAAPFATRPAIATAELAAARERFRRSRRRYRTTAIVGILLVVGGLTGFGIAGSQSDSIAAHGVTTTGTVVAAELYPRVRFSEHIDVRFATQAGAVVIARCWLGETDRYEIGQSVRITYDRSHPTDAQVTSNPDLGPIGFPLIFAIIGGAIAAWIGIATARRMSKASSALEGPGRLVSVTAAVQRDRRRRRAWLLQLQDEAGSAATASVTLLAGHSLAIQPPAQFVAYGDLKRRHTIVGLQPSSTLLVGRVARTRNHSRGGNGLSDDPALGG